MLPVGKTGIKV